LVRQARLPGRALVQPEDSAGESSYNRWLTDVADELIAAGIAVDSASALVVYSTEVLLPNDLDSTGGRNDQVCDQGFPGGRYWDRTSGLLGVNEALSR
jgi:hypothetical protein